MKKPETNLELSVCKVFALPLNHEPFPLGFAYGEGYSFQKPLKERFLLLTQTAFKLELPYRLLKTVSPAKESAVFIP